MSSGEVGEPVDGPGTYMQEQPPNPEASDPLQEEKMVQWGRGRAAKNPNGDCFYLAVGEGNGDFEGFDNRTVANNLRGLVGDHILSNQDFFSAPLADEQRLWREGTYQHLPRAQFNELWVREEVYKQGSWAILYMMSVAAAEVLGRDIVVWCLTGLSWHAMPGHGMRTRTWAELCEWFPPGERRDNVIVLLYNGDAHSRGNHFEHAKVVRREVPTPREVLETFESPGGRTKVGCVTLSTPQGETNEDRQERVRKNNKGRGKARAQLFTEERNGSSVAQGHMTQFFAPQTNRFAVLDAEAVRAQHTEPASVAAATEEATPQRPDRPTRVECVYTPTNQTKISVTVEATPSGESKAERAKRLNRNAQSKWKARHKKGNNKGKKKKGKQYEQNIKEHSLGNPATASALRAGSLNDHVFLILIS
jgi:hypothetical protein